MDRTAVFVDAGYLFATGAKLIAKERLLRGDLHLDHELMLAWLSKLASELTKLPLLRIYWYDGATGGPNPQQMALAYRPGVKLRLGFVNQQGHQKGVDSLIVHDLITLARNHAMADALLLTGDADILVGVQQAQEFGVRVHLLGIAPAQENQSGALVQEADSTYEISLTEIQSFLSHTPTWTDTSPPSASPEPTAPGAAPLDLVAQQLARAISPEEMDTVLKTAVGGAIPPQIDRRLLVAGTQAVGEPLSSEQKRRVRTAFLEACRWLTR